MKKNKSIFLWIGIGVLIVGLLVATMFIDGGEETSQTQGQSDVNQIIANAERESKAITESQMKDLANINMTTYLDYYNGTESQIIFVGRPTCPYCEITQPLVRKIAKDYDLNISYLNTDEFTDEDKANFVRHNEQFSEGYGTPMILVVSNGEIKAMSEGLTDSEHLIEFFKTYNIIQ